MFAAILRMVTISVLLSVAGILLILPTRPQEPVPAAEKKLSENLPAYHNEPPAGVLPATLGPAQFKKNRPAFVAYSLAGPLREVLYQQPCFCGCDKAEGHGSLLDCFTTYHGEMCHTCQAELFLCFELQKQRYSAAAIREALKTRQFMKLNLETFVRSHYRESKRQK
jgi:Protein of unknown function with PCYCGC motif